MNNLVVEYSLTPKRRGRKPGSAPVAADSGKLPRVTQLMALAIKFDGLLRDGIVRDYADLARLGHVTAGADDTDYESAEFAAGYSGRDPVPAEDNEGP